MPNKIVTDEMVAEHLAQEGPADEVDCLNEDGTLKCTYARVCFWLENMKHTGLKEQAEAIYAMSEKVKDTSSVQELRALFVDLLDTLCTFMYATGDLTLEEGMSIPEWIERNKS
jgi:hypothetical protein